MKKALFIILLPLLFLGGCVAMPQGLGYGLIQDSTDPILATSDVAIKVGEACGTNVLGIYASGDMSIDTAKKNGGITKVSSVDAKITTYFGIWGKKCTIVRGS